MKDGSDSGIVDSRAIVGIVGVCDRFDYTLEGMECRENATGRAAETIQ